MINDQPWIDLTHKASLALKNGQPIDTFQSHIQAVFEPSFDDHTFLQLNWKDQNVKWYRTTWLKTVDSFKFDPIENLKYIGQDIEPTLKYEKGNVNISSVINIIDLVRKTSVRPQQESFPIKLKTMRPLKMLLALVYGRSFQKMGFKDIRLGSNNLWPGLPRLSGVAAGAMKSSFLGSTPVTMLFRVSTRMELDSGSCQLLKNR